MSMAATFNPERLVPLKEAMRYGNFSHTRIYRLIGSGKIAAYKDGARTLIDLDSVDAYLRALPKVASRQRQLTR